MFRPELQTFLFSRVPNTWPVVQIGGAGPFIGYKYYPLQRWNGFLDLLKGAAKFLATIAFSAGAQCYQNWANSARPALGGNSL